MTTNTPRDGALPSRPYVLAWVALILLTLASFAVDRLHFVTWALGLSLAIAGVKALTVLLVFMHLRHAPFTLRFVAALNVLYVLLICLGIAGDVAAR
jgi:caa(3)-type oxidase subunit IV